MPQVRLRDGRALHVHTVGRGPTVLLLHGFAMNGAMWLPHVLPLAGAYRFVLPDLRGFGHSHHVPYAHRDVVGNHAEDVEDLIASLGVDRLILGGLSMGALTGLCLASRGGFGRVAGYVHIDQAACIHNTDDFAHGLFGAAQPERFAELRALLDAATPLRHRPFDELPGDLGARIREMFGRFLQTAVRPSWLKAGLAAVRHERVARMVLPLTHWPAYLDCLRAYLDERYDFSSALADAKIPVTVMVGDASEMYPAEGQLAFARSIPGASVVRFANAGHAIPVEAPVAFVRSLRRALAEAHGAVHRPSS